MLPLIVLALLCLGLGFTLGAAWSRGRYADGYRDGLIARDAYAHATGDQAVGDPGTEGPAGA